MYSKCRNEGSTGHLGLILRACGVCYGTEARGQARAC